MRFSQYLFGGIFLLFLIGIASMAIEKKMGHHFAPLPTASQQHTTVANKTTQSDQTPAKTNTAQ